MDNLAAAIFSQVTEANRTHAMYLSMGRAQMARDVAGVIGTLSVRKPAMTVIEELLALCEKERAAL